MTHRGVELQGKYEDGDGVRVGDEQEDDESTYRCRPRDIFGVLYRQKVEISYTHLHHKYVSLLFKIKGGTWGVVADITNTPSLTLFSPKPPFVCE